MTESANPMIPSLDEIAANPSLAFDLSPRQRSRVILRVSGVLAALGVGVDADDERGAAADRLLTVQEAAPRLGYKESYVYELARTKQIRSVKNGKYVRIPESAIGEYVAEHQAGPGIR